MKQPLRIITIIINTIYCSTVSFVSLLWACWSHCYFVQVSLQHFPWPTSVYCCDDATFLWMPSIKKQSVSWDMNTWPLVIMHSNSTFDGHVSNVTKSNVPDYMSDMILCTHYQLLLWSLGWSLGCSWGSAREPKWGRFEPLWPQPLEATVEDLRMARESLNWAFYPGF